MVAVPEAQLRLICGQDALTLYQFHTRTAQHFFCKVCGIYTHHRRRSDPTVFGVNAMCLDDFDSTGLVVRQNKGALRP